MYKGVLVSRAFQSNTDRVAEFDDKSGINCKMRNIVECAKMWMQFLIIKIRVFPTIISIFHSA